MNIIDKIDNTLNEDVKKSLKTKFKGNIKHIIEKKKYIVTFDLKNVPLMVDPEKRFNEIISSVKKTYGNKYKIQYNGYYPSSDIVIIMEEL